VSQRSLDRLLEGCARCGLCREVCIVERLGGHSITSFLCGEKDYSSWLCSSCWRCQEVCPQGVDIHAIMMLKRREQEPPTGHEANLANVMRFGYALDLGHGVNDLRRFHGLDAVQLVSDERLQILLHEQEGGKTGG
jgi:heterodisulfide reductase subunit C